MITPEEKVEAARTMLNRVVRERRTELGIDVGRSDLTINEAVSALSSMRNMPTRGTESDRQILKSVHWHQASPLSQYLNSQSEEYQRDSYRCGVYVIIELVQNEKVPLFVEALPRYPGMSTILSQRLRLHASGAFGSNPAEHVIKDFLLRPQVTETERAAYAVASRAEQREIRSLAMARRQLWVKTVHRDNKREADRLEHAMIRQYRNQGYELWNDILYTTGT